MLNAPILRPLAVAATIGLGAFALPANAAPLSAPAASFAAGGQSLANADLIEVDGRRHSRRYYRDNRRYYRGSRRHHRGDAAGAAVAAGIVGLALGAIIASPPPPPVVYYDNPRQPRRVYRNTYYGRPEPYSAEWYRYCAEKYRSFDARSGTFMSYSGVRKLCR